MNLFDGLLTVYSECRDCGQLMTVVNEMEHVHPLCTETPTKVESLLQGWLSCVMNGDNESAELTQDEIDVLIGSRPPRLARAAHRYAGFGWPVFPLSTCAKEPAIAKAKGGQGFKQAHCDVARIDRWWGKHPTHNIGLATGHSFDVIDIDPRHQGIPSFLELLRNKALPVCHGVAVTASGGMHLYVPATGKGNFANLRPGIDYRGKGGYVVAPPSTLGPPGRGYTWLTEPSPIIKVAS
jgi:hypothetical protein